MNPVHESTGRNEAPAAEIAERDKARVALTSVIAAVGLTTAKLAAGLATGSLGILSEAAHSGLDLVAAGVTLLAVRVGSRPADGDHPYGHGKVESLAALFEVLLLLATCGWIVEEAIHRLLAPAVPVNANLWAFGVLGLSIVVDISRSRALERVARRTGSQALEADALHFRSDVWSSGVVLVGLVLVRVSDATGIGWLARADSLAALGVAALVAGVSLRLAGRTVRDLIDGVPPESAARLRRAARVPGVLEIPRARVRRVGREVFADLALAVDGRLTLESACALAEQVRGAVRASYPGADVVVDLRPAREQSSGARRDAHAPDTADAADAAARPQHDSGGRCPANQPSASAASAGQSTASRNSTPADVRKRRP